MSRQVEATRTSPPGPSNWRKGQGTATQATRAWQTPAAAGGPHAPAARAALKTRIRVALLLAGFAFLAALFVYYLVLLPAKTPVITAVAFDYQWPLPPNAWAIEDAESLRADLDGQTLAVRDLSLSGVSNAEFLEGLEQELDRAAEQGSRSGALIVCLSAYGAVDGQGRPCLILPAADPLDSNSWLPLADVLARFQANRLPDNARRLLVLDCNRQHVNWTIGLPYNPFDERLEDAVTQANVPGLAVLNSVAPGQIGWASSQLGRSVFGHYFELGLAGAADHDEDGRVSLHELLGYLEERVDGWARQRRAARQTPTLYPAKADDFLLAWSLNSLALRRLAHRSRQPDASWEADARKRLAGLWRDHNRVEAFSPHHYAPVKWHSMEQELVWLEQAAFAGKAYHETFQQACGRIANDIERVLRHTAAGPSATPPVPLAAALAGQRPLPLENAAVRSKALAKHLGVADPSEKSSETHLLRLFDRYRVSQLWPAADIKRMLDFHQFSDQLGVPQATDQYAADDRAHFLVRPYLAACDVSRRAAEDEMFLGPQPTENYALRIEQARQQYDAAARAEAALARAYQARDRAWARLPYMAEWAAWREECEARKPVEQQLASGLREDTQKAMNAANRLDQLLRQAERALVEQPAAPEAILEHADVCAGAANEVEQPVKKLNDALLAETHRLKADIDQVQPATAETLRELAAVLESALISGADRAKLYERYAVACQTVDGEDDQAPPPESVVARQREPRWTIPAIAAMLGPSLESQSIAGDPLSLGARIRRAAAQLPREHAAAWSPTAPDNISRKPKSDDPEPAEVDRRLRRLAMLEGASALDPYEEIRRGQLRELLLWHCRRVLDDFWGPTEEGKPYFAHAAEAYLALAQPDPRTKREFEQLLDWRCRAASRGLATTSTDLILTHHDAEATTHVGVRAGPEARGFPRGLAAVFLRDEQGPLTGAARPLPIDPSQAESPDQVREVAVSVLPRDLTGRSPALQAVVVFRGHEFAAPLMVGEVGGTTTIVDRHRYGPSRITLWGPRKKASVVFILDCSYSMKGPVAVEAQADAVKLNVTVDALRGLLERLGERGDYRVGVRFFGHRVGWRTDEAGALARQENYPGGVPAELRPYEDVELFLPLGRFDTIAAGSVGARLKTLRPWGESPIYLSLMRALQDFDGEDPQAERRVVVLTDGMNNQFNPPPEAAPQRSEVEQAYRARGIAIDLIGFAIPGDERSTAEREFRILADVTKGSFTSATDALSLVRTLERLLRESEYRVMNPSGGLLAKALSGETATVDVQGLPQECSIAIGQSQTAAVLEGGELLRLTVGRDGGPILALRYEEGSPVFAPLVTAAPTRRSGYFAGLHRPLRTKEAVVFPISFQREDQGIPSRLHHVWIEIAPMLAGRSASMMNRYVFYDANYEPDVLAPLLSCECRNWPAGADHAEVRIWCLPKAIDAAATIALEQVANRTPPGGEGFTVAVMPGINFQVRKAEPSQPGDRLQVRVIERHHRDIPVHAMKLEVFPPPDRIVHQFGWEHGVVLHTFEYNATPSQPPELRFQSRDALTGNAWRLEQPAVLPVAEHNQVVVPPRVIDPSKGTRAASPGK